MAIKQLGATPSGSSDAATKGSVDTAISTALAAADGTGLTESAGVLSVGANYRSISIPFHLAGSITTGIKLVTWIAPVACTVVDMRHKLNAGTGTTTIRPSKNGGASDGTAGNVTTTAGNTSQSVSLAAGDRLTVNVTAVGTTPSELSVTFWANIT